VWGSAIYSTSLRYLMSENISRYGELIDTAAATMQPADFGAYIGQFMEQMQLISVKQILGYLVIITIFFFLLLLFHDMPARRELKPLPTWEKVGETLKRMHKIKS
jgi:hypothetical protein